MNFELGPGRGWSCGSYAAQRIDASIVRHHVVDPADSHKIGMISGAKNGFACEFDSGQHKAPSCLLDSHADAVGELTNPVGNARRFHDHNTD